jgi:hypothetical protein
MQTEFCKQLNYSALTQLINSRDQSKSPVDFPALIPGLLSTATCKEITALNPDTPVGDLSVGLKRLYWELHSGGFLRRLENLTHLQPLLPDPHLGHAGMMKAAQAMEKLHSTDAQANSKLTRICSLLIGISQPLTINYIGDNLPDSGSIEIKSGDCLIIDAHSRAYTIETNANNASCLLIHFYSLIA